jgi:predicted MFS family arabinose efflux permease
VLLNSIRTITADLLAPDVRGFGMGLYSTITQESGTIGAIFGGVIIDGMGFNMVFLSAAAMATIALFIVQLLVPEPTHTKNMRKIESTEGFNTNIFSLLALKLFLEAMYEP